MEQPRDAARVRDAALGLLAVLVSGIAFLLPTLAVGLDSASVASALLAVAVAALVGTAHAPACSAHARRRRRSRRAALPRWCSPPGPPTPRTTRCAPGLPGRPDAVRHLPHAGGRAGRRRLAPPSPGASVSLLEPLSSTPSPPSWPAPTPASPPSAPTPSSGLTWCLSIAAVVVVVRTALLPIVVHGVRMATPSSRARPAPQGDRRALQGPHRRRQPSGPRWRSAAPISAEHGVSRLGCLPLLLQIPIWIALYHLLRDVADGRAVGAARRRPGRRPGPRDRRRRAA